MSGSVYGNIFKISTWGESHGRGLGVVIDGCPAGIPIDTEDIQRDMDRRKPGTGKYATKRSEGDKVEILSGVFEGKTTGTPISLAIFNEDQRSRDYSAICDIFRPGHADFGFDSKYGFRDNRGGGRSSGRETAGRVAAGAVAKKLLAEIGVEVNAFTVAVNDIVVDEKRFDFAERLNNQFYMPDKEAAKRAAALLDDAMANKDSVGGIIQCEVTGLKPGIGEPVFDKLDASVAKGIMSIGAVKGIEFGAGFEAARMYGSDNNDNFYISEGKVRKYTNNSGGVLGGMSDGDKLVFRAAFKPTPSIAQSQITVNNRGENVTVEISGRHDPIIIPRAVVVVEAMTAVTLADLILMDMCARIDNVKKLYGKV